MWEKIKASLPLNILIAIGVVGALTGLAGIAREAVALRAEYAAAQAKITALREERDHLSRRIAQMETPEAIEREAKEKLNLKNKGESVVVVVPGRAVAPAGSPSSAWWARIRDFFRGMF
jgi:cell division protein FtsL